MTRFVHLSDVHVQVDYGQEPWLPLGWRRWAALVEMYGLGRRHVYARAEAELAALAQAAHTEQADHLLLSGDLTAMALDEEFARARTALGSWAERPGRLHVIPGNHDVYAPDAMRASRFESHFADHLQTDLPAYRREGPYPYVRLLGEDIAVIGLSSARVPLFPAAAVGWVGRAQRDGLARLLHAPELEGRFLFVMVHHAPLAPNGRQDTPTHRLADGPALLDLLRGDRIAVLFGHIHRRYRFESDGVRPHLFGCGSSTHRSRGGYWLYEVEGGRLTRAEMKALPRSTESAPPFGPDAADRIQRHA